MPTVVPFPAGINAYLADPWQILNLVLPVCDSCGGDSGWNVHAVCPRWTSAEGEWHRTIVFRTRCRRCEATTRMLPDFMLPYVQHGLPTILTGCETYIETIASYRRTGLVISGMALPEAEALATFWGSFQAPSPTPSTIWRWVDRFSRGACSWWAPIAAETQARDTAALHPPTSPDFPVKARSTSKRDALKTAWQLLWLLRLLLSILGMVPGDWPRILHFAPFKPSKLDHTGWFVKRAPVPP